MTDLAERINTVLNEEKRAYEANGRIRGGLGSFNITIQDGWTTEGKMPQLIQEKSNPVAIQSKHAALLLKLYAAINPKQKKEMRLHLLGQLSKRSQYFDVAYLIFFVLYKMGTVADAIKTASLNLKGDSDHGFSNMLAMLGKIVSYEYSYIDKDTYKKIKMLMRGEDEHSFQLIERINSAELKILEQELEDVSPEINYDRDKILNIWEKRFESKEIPSIIKEIEEYFLEGELTLTKFATCIGRIRVLLSEVTRQIAQKVSATKKDNKIAENSDEHKVFDYLRSEKYINDNEWNLLRSLYGMASDTGAHAAISNREYARLTKNMAYELILLLMSRDPINFIDRPTIG